MRRLLISCAVALSLFATTAVRVGAEVKTREKTHVSLGGMLGKMFNLFGGKAAKEGIVATTAVKGNRKATINDTTGQIVDLSEEKVYDLDMKKKTYEVTTFEQIRQKMREAREKAAKQTEQQGGKEEKQEKNQPQKEYEVDFDVKETGQKKQLAGYDTHEVIMTVTVREKGKTLEDGGGLVMTVDSWLGPQIPALKELAEFDMKYWKQLAGSDMMGMSAEQLAMVMAMYPTLKQASDRMQKEAPKLQGTALASTTTVDGVKSKEEVAASSSQNSDTPKSIGGIGGMLARKMAKKDDSNANGSANRATIFTAEHEFQEVQTSVAAADVEMPAGFKQK